MSPFGNRVMSQVDLLADAEYQIAIARTAMAAPSTPATNETITCALSRASFLLWVVSQEQTDPTAPSAHTPAYMMPVPAKEIAR